MAVFDYGQSVDIEICDRRSREVLLKVLDSQIRDLESECYSGSSKLNSNIIRYMFRVLLLMLLLLIIGISWYKQVLRRLSSSPVA